MSTSTLSPAKILVIKLGALGDFIQACGPMAAIRRHHAQAHITLLTTRPYADLARQTGYFDDILIDARPRWFNLHGWRTLARTLRAGSYSRVYDLQNNDRTTLYFRLFRRNKPEWVGIAPGASHRNISPERTKGLAFDGHVQTLGLAGIHDVAIDNLSWLDADLEGLRPAEPYALLVPGSAPNRLEKRWPAASYAALAQQLADQGITPLIIGGPAEEDIAVTITRACPAAANLTGRTSLGAIAALARNAVIAIGNDTGPMHIIAPTGCPSLILFSRHSNPVRHAPKGPVVTYVQVEELTALSAGAVWEKTQTLMAEAGRV